MNILAKVKDFFVRYWKAIVGILVLVGGAIASAFLGRSSISNTVDTIDTIERNEIIK